MQSFIADSTGYSERDREINEEIEQISHHIRSKSRSSLCESTRNHSRTSMSSRLSGPENSSSQQKMIKGQQSRTSLQCKWTIKHCEKTKLLSRTFNASKTPGKSEKRFAKGENRMNFATLSSFYQERTIRAERSLKLDNEFSLASCVEATCENFTTKDCLS